MPRGSSGSTIAVVAGQQCALLVTPRLHGAGELGQGTAGDGQHVAGLRRGGDVADPDRAELVVGEVPLRAGLVVLTDVQGRLVARARPGGRHDEHRTLDGLARQPDERRRGPERVLRIVGAGPHQPRGDDDELAGEVLARGRPGVPRRVRGDP